MPGVYCSLFVCWLLVFEFEGVRGIGDRFRFKFALIWSAERCFDVETHENVIRGSNGHCKRVISGYCSLLRIYQPLKQILISLKTLPPSKSTLKTFKSLDLTINKKNSILLSNSQSKQSRQNKHQKKSKHFIQSNS